MTGNRSVQSGQSSVEVLVILMFVVIVLGSGQNSPIQQLGDAFRARFAGFTEAISRP